jgi:methylmalonyl-CoA/ethylmalonyl-CoA epimerase
VSTGSETIRLAHVALIVRNLEASARAFGALLGLAPTGREVLPQEGIRLAFVRIGDARLELMEPRDPRGALGRFLAARGEGIHHLAFTVPDVAAAIAQARAAGLQLIDEAPRHGAGGARIAFLHPSGTHGVLVELVEE